MPLKPLTCPLNSPHFTRLEYSIMENLGLTRRHAMTYTPLGYFRRHWRGELSLPVSFCVNDLLGRLALSRVADLLSATVMGLETAYAPAASIILYWSLVLPVEIGLLVGVWRAAEHHRARTGRRGSSRIAQTVVLIQLLVTFGSLTFWGVPAVRESLKLALVLKQLSDLEINVYEEDTVLVLTGGIGPGFRRKVTDALDHHPRVRVVYVNMPQGGLIEEATVIGQVIHARGLTTYTSWSCVSACTFVFLGGKARYLKRGAQLGFHGPSGVTAPFWGITDEIARERALLITAGVAAGFADKALAVPPNTVWYPEASELVAAGVVTAVTDGPP